MRPEKTSIVEDLLSRLQASPFLIITDYHGLKVDQFSTLRTRLGEVGAKYTVVKNTFLNRAAHEAGLPDLGAEPERTDRHRHRRERRERRREGAAHVRHGVQEDDHPRGRGGQVPLHR